MTTAIRNAPQAAGCKYFNHEKLRLELQFCHFAALFMQLFSMHFIEIPLKAS